MNVIKMTMKEFLEKGNELFGEDKRLWKFVCPACATVISCEDYITHGANDSAIAFNCIGRYMDNCQRAFSEKKIIKGEPCDYTTGGLFNISPLEIDGQRYFKFYEKDGK